MGFEEAYRAAVGGERQGVSPELRGLLHGVYEALVRPPVQLDRVKGGMVSLLAFLVTPEGRTDANCQAVDYFFMLDENWEGDWAEGLREDFVDVLADVAGALHDTIRNPQIAENFESTPEQLLARARALNAPRGNP